MVDNWLHVGNWALFKTSRGFYKLLYNAEPENSIKISREISMTDADLHALCEIVMLADGIRQGLKLEES